MDRGLKLLGQVVTTGRPTFAKSAANSNLNECIYIFLNKGTVIHHLFCSISSTLSLAVIFKSKRKQKI